MAEQGFTLHSPDITPGGRISAQFTCDGGDRPPRLEWMHAPEGTKSFALIVEDPDAPGGTFTHWVKFNLPGDLDHLPADGAGVDGKNDFQQDGYRGPCPPANHGEHRYIFRLYALAREKLDLPKGAQREALEAALDGHVLEQTELMGRYDRKPTS